MISVLSMYSVGIGPSSSHTLGPMRIGGMFLEALRRADLLGRVDHLRIDLYGSLSLTGKGHQTDTAAILGLAGENPEQVDVDAVPAFLARIRRESSLALGNERPVKFQPDLDVVFHQTFLTLHENGMTLTAFAGEEPLLHKTYYSVGGGVVEEPETFGQTRNAAHVFPYPYGNAEELLRHCRETGYSLSRLVLENELSLVSREKLTVRLRHVWEVMRASAERGLHAEGLLPGPMRIARRAPALYRRLTGGMIKQDSSPFWLLDRLNMYALAVSEENAAGGRVVTAPTNGACGVVPAVLLFYDNSVNPVTDAILFRYFLAAGAVGALFRTNASISGAEVGCQGEVGVAASMAAAGLAELFGGSPEQVCTAAEIAMEHNLGLTCDPVGGQVQIPCIERNAVNAVKAVNAARMAMERQSTPLVSLDKVMEAMMLTGKEMSPKYRETAQGGLASVRLPGCS